MSFGVLDVRFECGFGLGSIGGESKVALGVLEGGSGEGGRCIWPIGAWSFELGMDGMAMSVLGGVFARKWDQRLGTRNALLPPNRVTVVCGSLLEFGRYRLLGLGMILVFSISMI